MKKNPLLYSLLERLTERGVFQFGVLKEPTPPPQKSGFSRALLRETNGFHKHPKGQEMDDEQLALQKKLDNVEAERSNVQLQIQALQRDCELGWVFKHPKRGWVDFSGFFGCPCKLESFLHPWKTKITFGKSLCSIENISAQMVDFPLSCSFSGWVLFYFGQSNAAGGLETIEICKCKKPSLVGPATQCWSTRGYKPLPHCGNDARWTICIHEVQQTSLMKDSLLQRKLDRFPKLAFFTGLDPAS